MTRPNLSTLLRDQVVIFDGAMGTEIYKKHVFVNVCFDQLSVGRPDMIKEIHQSYLDAGADVLITNSFGANQEKLKGFGLSDQVEAINSAAAQIAREVADGADRPILVAGSIGPLPFGQHTDAQLVEEIATQAKALVAGGADFILFESQSSRRDLVLAVEAMRQLPTTEFVLSFTVDHDASNANGESLNELMADFDGGKPSNLASWGINCSVGPEVMLNTLDKVMKMTQLPVIVQPNAGMPKKVSGRQLYMSSPEYFTTYAMRYVNLGARGVGGCCGTSPDHIREMVASVKPFYKNHFDVSQVEISAKAEPVKAVPLAERSNLGRKLANGEWITSVEITPPRGYDLEPVIQKAIACREAGIDTINIPDGPRASSRMSAMITSQQILERAGIEPVLHFCCRDRNLIGMQSDLLGCAAVGLHNILFITGDPPKLGNYPFATAVFDADAIGIVKIQERLNCGIDLGGDALPKPTQAIMGVGADPSAIDFAREMSRFREKVEAGAEYVTTQPVFDADALMRFIDQMGDHAIPVIAGIWPLASLRNAEFMQTEVPGVHVPDSIMKRMSRFEQKEDQKKEGIAIAIELLDKVRPFIQGVQVSAPFGNVFTAIEVIKGGK